ncbi:heterokaryon incompatibility protein-domain-containing protein [Phyllosticta capitalensis]
MESPSSATKDPLADDVDTNPSSDRLCHHCSQLNICRQKFHVADERPLPGLENYDSSGLSRRTLGFLDDIYRKSTTCPLCRLILHATHENDDDHGNIGYDGLDRLGERVECQMEWQLDGREIVDAETMSLPIPKTRRLRLFSDKAAFAEAHIVLMEETSSHQEPTFLGRVVDKAEMDIDLLRRWIHLCESSHGPGCTNPQTRDVGYKELIFVDVHDMCLVVRPLTCRYLALSYVWGLPPRPSMMLVKSNLEALFHHGSLSQFGLSRTISDAIDLCRDLGERLIWVDRLCIPQDCPNTLQYTVPLMDVIFGNAVLTICDASGDHMEAGLPGSASQPRSVRQNIQRIEGMDLMAVRSPEKHISGSVWNKRSWVFQERLLSRRLLLFAGQRIFFQCRQATWSEEIHAEGTSIAWTLDMVDAPLVPEKSNPVRHFADCVQLYSVRNLTYESDKLLAFEGIAKSLEIPLGTTFHYGLPAAYFDWALLWDPVSPARRIRVSGDCRVFPSWSWCGWMVGVEWRLSAISGCLYNLHDWLVNHTWIEWFLVQQDKTLRPVWSHDGDNSPAEGSDSDFTSGRWTGYGKATGLRRRGLLGHSRWLYPVPAEEDVASAVSENAEILQPGSLCFFTYSAFFTLSRKSMSSVSFTSELQAGLQRLGILDKKGDWCGTIVLEESWMRKIGQPLEFIALSEARDFSLQEYDSWTYYVPRRREQSEWDTYFALLVKKTETGAYERVGLAKIFKHAFHVNSFSPGLVWKQVVLG